MSDIENQLATVIGRTKDLSRLAGYGYVIAAEIRRAMDKHKITNTLAAGDEDWTGYLLEMADKLLQETADVEWLHPDNGLN